MAIVIKEKFQATMISWLETTQSRHRVLPPEAIVIKTHTKYDLNSISLKRRLQLLFNLVRKLVCIYSLLTSCLMLAPSDIVLCIVWPKYLNEDTNDNSLPSMLNF